MVSKPKLAGPVPSTDALREVALRYLSRFAATEAGVVRMLDGRTQRWARRAAAEGLDVTADISVGRNAARQIAKSLVEQGLIDDALFASARARRLVRSGKSRKVVAAHLAAKGVQPETAQAVLPGPDRELMAALAYARRRRLGPFKVQNTEKMDPDEQPVCLRELGALARAGFSHDVAQRALQMPPLEAQAMLIVARQT